MTSTEIEELLAGLTERLADTLAGEPFDPTPASDVGTALVAAHFTGAETLGRTIVALAAHLAAFVAPDRPVAEAASRVAAIQGALATGYTHALWTRTMEEQEQIRTAVLVAKASAQEAMRNSEARFRAVFAGADIGIGIADLDGNILEINHRMAEMMGRPAAVVTGANLMSMMDREDIQTYYALVGGGRDHTRFEKMYRRPDGSPLWTDITISLIRDSNGSPQYTLTMVRDVTQQQLLRNRLEYQATHDPLTGLPNRTLFFEWLDELFATAGPTGRIGLCYLDLDGFKVVNDTLGHDVGDRLLAVVAGRLEDRVSELGHRAARMGGDEFVLLVRDPSGVAEVTRLADAVIEALRPPIEVAGHRLNLSASIGIVERPIHGTTPAELMTAADITLYWAKADGKARWALYDRDRNARQLARYALSAAMPAALDGREFFVDYQPLVRLDDGTVLGVEALVRWRHPRLGRLGPDVFIGLAEETGLIVPLGAWVLEEACRQAKTWRDIGQQRHLFISVNFAARQARAPGIVEDVAGILDRTGLEPTSLQLELTESAVMGTADEPLEALRDLSRMGVRIAIDDFGTGYSNLAYLRRLPVHGLKLAGSFVEGLSTAASDAIGEQIVAALVSMAHALGLTVTAEGVEAALQADRLRELGCDAAQGYFFSRPAPASLIGQFLDPATGPGRLPRQRPTGSIMNPAKLS